MSYTHSFTIVPPPRYDNVPWTQVTCDEATTIDGPYTTLATVTITPDTTPGTPEPVDLTVTSSALPVGYYRFRFADAGNSYSPYTAPFLDPPPTPAAGYTPVVRDLADLLPARAAGRFTGGQAATFPDEQRVQTVILMAAALVAPRLGGNTLPSKFYDLGRALITLRAAMLLEPAAWPEQARPDKSAYEQWREQFDTEIAALIDVIRLDAEDGDTGDGGPESTTGWLVAGGFPLPGLPVVGGFGQDW